MDPTAFHTIIQLVKNGTLDLDDLEEIAERLKNDGEDDAAFSVRAAYVEAQATPEKTEAELRREQMVLVPRLKLGADGGNGTD